MGSGASTQDSLRVHRQFQEVERKCQTGYYSHHVDEYKRILEGAIELEALDFIEVLLVGGPAKLAFPLHIAAEKGRVEALDLMLGAGYPGNAKNLQGNTPLHLLAMNTPDPESASLCASLLCLRYPNLWKIYNNRGLASIHVAAQCGNAGVLEAMGSHGADMTFKTMDGQSLTDIAREYDHPEILKLLSNATSNHMARKRLSMGSQLHYTPAPPKEVDMERIMQVWDRFFENAFRMAEQREAEKRVAKQQQVKASKKSKRRQQFEEKEFEEDRYSRSGGNHIYSSPHTTAYSTSSNNHVYDWVEDKPYISSVYEAKHDEVDDQVDAVYYECLDWFQHVLFHSATHNEYFIVHLHSGASYWLADYYEFLTTGVMADYYRFLVDDVDILAAYSLPTNLLIGAQLGWMVCYDSQGNYCYWRQLLTDATENYLPFGQDYETESTYAAPEVLDWLQLERYEDGSVYYSASQAVAQGWVLVVINSDIEEEESRRRHPQKQRRESQIGGTGFYYFNLYTQETRWTAPGSDLDNPEGSFAWLKLLDSWGSWRLCCMEDNPQAFFWYDVVSGESVWT